MKLRPYQEAALAATIDAFGAGKSRVLVVKPTGTGKTVLFAALVARVAQGVRSRSGAPGRSLVLAHREELVRQAREKIETSTGITCGVEMADERADTLRPPLCVVASVQSMQRDRLRSYAVDHFDLVVVDEAHHATAQSYRTILDHFGGARVLGVTATPDRGDKQGLKAVFEAAAYVYEIRDAIRDGWLVPIVQRQVIVDSLDLSKVSVRAGDYADGELEEQLCQERALHEVAVPTLEQSGSRPTVVFTAGVAQARALAEVLNRYRGGSAVALSGETHPDDRRKSVDDFKGGRVQFLVNCALFLEGFDAPLCACVAMARPTKSRALYAQAIGRGTRILGLSLEESVAAGKSDLLVLDFVGNSSTHSLVSVADVLDGSVTEEVAQRVTELVKEEPDLPVHVALERAGQQLAEEARRRALATARFRTIEIDPFSILGAVARPGRWGGMPVTDRQAEMLDRVGIDVAHYDRGQASELIGRIIDRRQAGLCSYKQARLLARAGLNPDVSFEVAVAAIDELARNRWRAPESLMRDPRLAPSQKGVAA